MAAQWPRVKAWLVATIPTLPGLTDVVVYNGPEATTDAPDRYVAVGAVDDEQNAGTYGTEQAYDGSMWAETGEVRSTIVAQSGDSDPSIAEAAAFGIADAIEARVRAGRTLDDTLSPQAEVRTSVDVISISNGNGTATELVLTLTYTTTT